MPIRFTQDLSRSVSSFVIVVVLVIVIEESRRITRMSKALE